MSGVANKKARQEQTSTGASDATKSGEAVLEAWQETSTVATDETQSNRVVLTKRKTHLPVPLLKTIYRYSGGGARLGETYKEAYKVIPGHYKVDMLAATLHFGRVPEHQANMGFQPEGGRMGIRSVKQITITNAGRVGPEVLVSFF